MMSAPKFLLILSKWAFKKMLLKKKVPLIRKPTLVEVHSVFERAFQKNEYVLWPGCFSPRHS